jgi:hypothetical protein
VSDLATFQERFAAGLLGGPPAVALGGAMRDLDWTTRFAVYQNNVVTALADAVVRNHPAVERLVGIEFLRGAAVAYVRAHPPRARDLTLAGEGFAAFLRGFPPAARLPYLPDVAALDRARLEVLFAADAKKLDARAIAGRDPEAIAALRPGLVPSARVLASPYPAYSIWRNNREGDGAARIRLDAGGEIALVWRGGVAVNGSCVRHRALTPGEAAFVRALEQGGALAEAGAAALTVDPSLDLAAAFGGLLAAGVLARPADIERRP